MPAINPVPINRPWVRDVLSLVPAILLVTVGGGLAFGAIDKSLWWLLTPPSGLLGLAIVRSGGCVGQTNSAKFTTDLSNGQIDLSHQSELDRRQ